MTDVYLAQINIARFRAAPEDPVNADFMAALDSVNAEAEASDGFIWRLTDGNNATDIRLFSDHLLLNMSVWRDLGAACIYLPQCPTHGHYETPPRLV